MNKKVLTLCAGFLLAGGMLSSLSAVELTQTEPGKYYKLVRAAYLNNPANGQWTLDNQGFYLELDENGDLAIDKNAANGVDYWKLTLINGDVYQLTNFAGESVEVTLSNSEVETDKFYTELKTADGTKYYFIDYDGGSTVNQYALVGYNIENTLTENGSVKRGICKMTNNYLTELIESKVEKKNDTIEAEPLSGKSKFTVDKNTLVSMNMLVFTPSIFPYIKNQMTEFFKEHANDLSTCEFLIPDVLSEAINCGYATVEVLPTTAKWIGVTYKEDTEPVVCALQKMIKEGVYPENLWEKS